MAALGADALIERSPAAPGTTPIPLRKAERTAAHQMDEGQESLYAELTLTGSTAWNRLHGDVTSLLTAEVGDPDGSVRTLPITVVRNLAADADAGVRRRAYDAELEAWEKVAVPCAAALNAIKGEANAVNARRGWADPIEPVLHANSVDRRTLDAMQAAVVASLPDWRRYLRAKARLLGSAGPDGGLPWWDLFAPVGDPSAAAVDWDGGGGHGGGELRRLLAGPGRPGPAGPERGLDRRRGPRREAGRGLLHGHHRRGEPGTAQLRSYLRLGLHPGPRVGPRLPQHDPGPAHAAATESPRWPWPRRLPSSARPC